MDEIGSGCDELKVEISFRVHSDSGGGEVLAKRTVESFEEEVPIHLLQPKHTLDNEDIRDWVVVSALRRHRADFNSHFEDRYETYFDDDNTIFSRYGGWDGNRTNLWTMSFDLP